MKKTLLFAAIVSLLLCSCTSKEKQAQKLIKEYLAEDLEFPKTYKPISFGTLDSVFSQLETSEGYIYYNKQIIESQRRADDLARNIDERLSKEYNDAIRSQVQSALNRVEKYRNDLEDFKANFSTEFMGWSMRHDYQYTDNNGPDKTWGVFFFDEDLTTVLREE